MIINIKQFFHKFLINLEQVNYDWLNNLIESCNANIGHRLKMTIKAAFGRIKLHGLGYKMICVMRSWAAITSMSIRTLAMSRRLAATITITLPILAPSTPTSTILRTIPTPIMALGLSRPKPVQDDKMIFLRRHFITVAISIESICKNFKTMIAYYSNSMAKKNII